MPHKTMPEDSVWPLGFLATRAKGERQTRCEDELGSLSPTPEVLMGLGSHCLRNDHFLLQRKMECLLYFEEELTASHRPGRTSSPASSPGDPLSHVTCMWPTRHVVTLPLALSQTYLLILKPGPPPACCTPAVGQSCLGHSCKRGAPCFNRGSGRPKYLLKVPGGVCRTRVPGPVDAICSLPEHGTSPVTTLYS